MPVTWSDRDEEAQWWVERLHPFRARDNGSTIPEGFKVYLPLFHPIESGLDGHPVPRTTWTALAEANSRVAHCDMQLHLVAAPPGVTLSWQDAHQLVWVGDQEPEDLAMLATILADHTSTPTTPGSRCGTASGEPGTPEVCPPCRPTIGPTI